MGYYIPDDMWESLSEQPKTVQNAVFGAVARLFFTGEEDALTGVSKSLFVAFRDRVLKSRTNERNRKGKSRNGNGNETDNENGNGTDNETRNESDNESDNETDNENGNGTGTDAEGNRESAIKGGGGGREDFPNGNSKPPIPPEVFAEIIGYLNVKTGKAFKDTSKATRSLIRARMAEGYTVDDFKRVIDNKAASWLNDPKMDAYLQPSTLFGKTKFEGYLNERPVAARGGGDFERYA